MRPPLPIVSTACLALLLHGCAQSPANVVFVTKSSLGIDVEASAQNASVAYDRTEGYFAPRYADQAPAPVFASLQTNGAMIDRKIKQNYATGKAAVLLSQPVLPPPPATRQALFRTTALEPLDSTSAAKLPEPVYANADLPPKAMFFGTGTVLGLKLGFGPTAIDSFTLGFKRKEMSIIPQDERDRTFPSVLASFDSTAEATTLTGSGLSINQFFATGSAADGLAVNSSIHAGFIDKAVSALGEYREEERAQRRFALLSLACLSELDDAQSAKVWNNVAQLGVFDAPGIADLLAATTATKARTVYTQEMGRINVTAKNQTGLMHGHQVYVCDLRSKT